MQCPSLLSQYGSGSMGLYTESAYEEIPYAEPAKDVWGIYDQLAQERCIEIPRVVLKWENWCICNT